MFPKLDQIICNILDTQAGTVTPSWSRTFYIDLCVKFSVNTMTAHLADWGNSITTGRQTMRVGYR